MRHQRFQLVWLLSALVLAACSESQAAPSQNPPPPAVSVAKPVVRQVQDWHDFHGRLEAVQSVDLRPRVSGHIASVHFTEGARVKKDQVLFEIDGRPFREDVNRLEAELRRNESQLVLARANLQRGERLLKEGATSLGELDQLHAAEANAAAGLDSTRSLLAAARLNLEYTHVRAPIAGRVSNVMITTGNLVSNANQLTRIVTDDPIYAYFDVEEAAYLALTGPGGEAAVVEMGLSVDNGFPHRGKLDFVDNQVDPRTGTIRARAVFANPDRRLTPGLFSRVRLLSDKQFNALLIDEKALLTDQNRKYVYVLDIDGRAQRRDVRLGRSAFGLRIIEEGLNADDRVVVQGIQKVFAPGMPVQAEEVAMVLAQAPTAAAAPVH
ncbi:MAG: efflux RND transporter periplasmic adaptor subunit [Polyangiales bacterium]